MKDLIGTATVQYDEQGFVKGAIFEPNPKFQLDNFSEMSVIKATNEDDIQRNAELAMAEWFMRQNKIELSDRDEYKITSKMDVCERRENRSIEKVVISFYFESV